MKQLKKYFLTFLVLCLLLTSLAGCKKSVKESEYSKTVVATYGTEKIYLDEVNFILKRNQMAYDMYANYYLSAGNISSLSEFYELDLYGTGIPIGDTIREDVMAGILQTRILGGLASEFKISLDDSDKELIANSVKEYMEESDPGVIKATGATEDLLTSIYERNLLANKVYDYLVADIDKKVERDDFRQRKLSYIYIKEDKVEEGKDDTTDEKKFAEEILEEVKDLYEKEKDVKKVDLSKLVTSYKENDDYKDFKDSISASSRVIGDKINADKSAFGTEGLKLKTGEAAIAHVESSGYYVIFCVDDYNDEETDKQIEAEYDDRRAVMFKSKYKEYQEAAPEFEVLKKVYEQLKFNEIKYENVPETTEEITTEKSTEAGTTKAGSIEASTEKTTEEATTENPEATTEESKS